MQAHVCVCVFVQEGKAGPAGQATEGMLANFFNSLLNKKTGAAVAGKGVWQLNSVFFCFVASNLKKTKPPPEQSSLL